MNNKKVLFCATVDYHFKAFHLPYLKWFQDQGWEVHVAAEGSMSLPYTNKKFSIPIQRSPFRLSNFRACKQLKDIIEQEQYRIIHCHTPLGGVLSRIAAKGIRKSGAKVLYTAHGFHFFKGAPLVNWLYYPIERILSSQTDCLITINQEDYEFASKHLTQARTLKHVRGVGVNMKKYRPLDEKEKWLRRSHFHYTEDQFLMIYVAEFNRNKNHQFLIQAFAHAKDELSGARLLFAGEGPLLEKCIKLAEQLKVKDRIDFLGFRNDIDQLLPICDIALSASLREGLPVNILEAMACGLPIIATNNRGHRELITANQNGFLIGVSQVKLFAKKLITLYGSVELRERFSEHSLEFVQPFSLEHVRREMDEVYLHFMMEDTHATENQYYRAYL
ncbi:glycosyltransferase family 4 protein [Halalkalibacter hemicellulosilyticus]|uniref:Glycosyltransferase n=1 Tax=Halalkalibacter hemicellulosilyticusJCM 9152 TaxID=1236971 RepID=W4QDK4_9BACI|nr:glycosyltransferase family 4 protein [Halalkalibacter hemicellulosilyticus]GAE30022.1 glycosyltransferase [Halalkalibacter hemicellulosilyticusJCM 9152]